eukprot:1835582-Amphidinium_carterae.1
MIFELPRGKGRGMFGFSKLKDVFAHRRAEKEFEVGFEKRLRPSYAYGCWLVETVRETIDELHGNQTYSKRTYSTTKEPPQSGNSSQLTQSTADGEVHSPQYRRWDYVQKYIKT